MENIKPRFQLFSKVKVMDWRVPFTEQFPEATAFVGTFKYLVTFSFLTGSSTVTATVKAPSIIMQVILPLVTLALNFSGAGGRVDGVPVVTVVGVVAVVLS
jgi:hypothetical protein